MEPLKYDIDGKMMTVEAMSEEMGRLSVIALGWRKSFFLPWRRARLSPTDVRRLALLANALAMAAGSRSLTVETMRANAARAYELLAQSALILDRVIDDPNVTTLKQRRYRRTPMQWENPDE